MLHLISEMVAQLVSYQATQSSVVLGKWVGEKRSIHPDKGTRNEGSHADKGKTMVKCGEKQSCAWL